MGISCTKCKSLCSKCNILSGKTTFTKCTNIDIDDSPISDYLYTNVSINFVIIGRFVQNIEPLESMIKLDNKNHKSMWSQLENKTELKNINKQLLRDNKLIYANVTDRQKLMTLLTSNDRFKMTINAKVSIDDHNLNGIVLYKLVYTLLSYEQIPTQNIQLHI